MHNELLVSWGKNRNEKPPILTKLLEHLDNADQVVLASAYVSIAGVELLLPAVKRILQRKGSVSIYATLDMSIHTRPDAFSTLIHLVESNRDRLSLYLYPSTNSLFHAKTFLVRKGSNWSALVGSANLTESALTGTNFETAVNCTPIAADQVNNLITKLNELRTRGRLLQVTPDNLRKILSLFWLGDEELEPDPKRRAERRAEARASRKPVGSLAPPVPVGEQLAPLSLAELSPRDLVSQICATGIGVGVTTDLEGLTVSVQLDRFVRAGLVSRETSKQLNKFVSHSQRSGFSFALVPAELRSAVASAGKSVGKRIGSRSIDLGFARWVPRLYYRGLSAEIERDDRVRDARKAIASRDGALHRHLDDFRRRFADNMRVLAKRLQLEPASAWKVSQLQRLGSELGYRDLSRTSKPATIRRLITGHLDETYRVYLSEDFVRTRLARVSFVPRVFEFPLEQTLGDDADYGHKYFLASLVWAYTDRVLKRSGKGGGRGEVFHYLDARAASARGTQGPRDMAEWAGSWLEPTITLEKAVTQFLNFFGDASWSWVTQRHITKSAVRAGRGRRAA